MNPKKIIIVAAVTLTIVLSGYLVYLNLASRAPVPAPMAPENTKVVLDRETTPNINAIVRIYRLTDGKVILTDNDNMTLYFYASDSENVSHCSGTCSKDHPPLIKALGEQLIVGPAVQNGSVSLFDRETGSQAAYKGRPLYTFSGDDKPGDTNGADKPQWEIATPF